MIIDLTRLTANTQTWAQNPSTADVSVTLNGTARTLSGMDAAAYLFGQALTTIKFQGTLDGVQLTDGRFEFPPASGQWVSLGEVADALRYKYGVDPLIEFAPGLGVRGYSVADINRILEALNREFADQFSLTLLSSAAVIGATQATVDAEIAAGNTAFYAPVISYLTDLSTKATALRDFYTARRPYRPRAPRARGHARARRCPRRVRARAERGWRNGPAASRARDAARRSHPRSGRWGRSWDQLSVRRVGRSHRKSTLTGPGSSCRSRSPD